ncbi:hypothetical protein C8Q76DRAFT_80283 [Earliella scabrosa]|nr:hypothetical protein C8Q76DRAFT_80283 [Earliella scabrosa]
MSRMSRVALAKIPSLTFYKDSQTLSRRGQPIPQLTCIGKPCRLYQPEAVRCTNIGGSGTDVDWKCEADLPDSLRFGRVQVSCEGWDGPGDPYVMKGSCGLEYRLVQVPAGLRGSGADDPSYPARFSRWLHELAEDPIAFAFALLWVAVLALIIYNAVKSCFGSRTRTDTRGGSTPRAPPPRGPGSGWFSGWGTHPDSYGPPPPYTKHAPHSGQGVGDAGGWRPGFWTGAALGWLGTQWMNRQREQQHVRAPGMYDWEAERMFAPRVVRTAPLASPSSASWWGGAARRRGFDDGDRGEGPSDLGRMRRSTGLGGSNVR